MKIKIKLSYLILVLALALAGCAAYFSVWGLSQLFAGASTAVIIMAGILETAKIVSTTALHKYWNKLAKGLRAYLTASVVVLMIITSAGIYGFLSNAYQKTANKLEIHEGELGVLDGKKKIFEDALLANNKIIDSKNKRIDQLSGLRSNQESRIDAARGNTNALRSDINSSNAEIQKLSTEIDAINAKNSVLNDSISKYQSKGLELKAGSDVAGEVGPLKYVSELTGISMDRVVNYMILLLIVIFDPLAVALILTVNRIFQIEKEEEEALKANNDAVNDALNDTVKVKNEGVNEGVKLNIEGVNEGVNTPEEPVNIDEPSFEAELHEDEENIDEDVIDDAVNEIEVIDEEIVEIDNKEEEAIIEIEMDSEPEEVKPEVPQPPIQYFREPVKKTGKVELEDIKEIKEGRGFSVMIPEPKANNTVERIGNNKFLMNGDNKKIYYRRDDNK